MVLLSTCLFATLLLRLLPQSEEIIHPQISEIVCLQGQAVWAEDVNLREIAASYFSRCTVTGL